MACQLARTVLYRSIKKLLNLFGVTTSQSNMYSIYLDKFLVIKSGATQFEEFYCGVYDASVGDKSVSPL